MSLYVTLSFAISPKALRRLVPGAEEAANQDADNHTKAELMNWRNYLWSVLQHHDEEPEDASDLSFLE